MITHIVLYRLKDPTDENCAALVEKFLSMRGKIPMLRTIEAGTDVVRSERSYDVALVCTFDNVRGLDAYREHPVHLPIMEYVRGVVERSHSVDFESR